MKYFLFPFLCFLSCSSVAGKSDNVESVISFGDNLYLNGNYFNALHEYQRAYFFSGSELKCVLGNKIADCYLVLGNFRMARSFYDSAIFYSGNDRLHIDFEFKKILCFMKENNFGYALLKLDSLEPGADNYLQGRKSLYQGICCFGTGQYEASYQYFLNFIPQIDTIKRLQLKLLYENRRTLKRPNSLMAILLSIVVPGAGQVYSGDLKNGLNSLFLLSGLLYIGSSGSSGTFMSVIPFFYKYYSGGIIHSKQIAERKRKEKKYIYYTNLMEILLK